MIGLDDIIIGYIVGLLAWYGWQSQKSREYARQIAANYCKQLDLQLLDDTVALHSIRLRKNRLGRLRIARNYYFEFSSMGDERYQGELELLGNELAFINTDVHRV